MLKFSREKASASTPVENLLRRVEEFGYDDDDYLRRVQAYLSYADRCRLTSQAVVYSCIDLAETYTDIPEIAEMRRGKIDAWQSARTVALLVTRDPVEVDMELDPVYFEAILSGEKTYEGRAYKPNSDKNYPGLRTGDHIRFHLSSREEEFTEDALRRGLIPDMEMVCTIGEVYFAPTVHGVFQIPRFNGLGFQPMVSEVHGNASLQLERAAVYHVFPGYHELIAGYGFLGIQVENPQLLSAC